MLSKGRGREGRGRKGEARGRQGKGRGGEGKGLKWGRGREGRGWREGRGRKGSPPSEILNTPLYRASALLCSRAIKTSKQSVNGELKFVIQDVFSFCSVVPYFDTFSSGICTVVYIISAKLTRSSAVAERPRDASCLSVVCFNKPTAQFFLLLVTAASDLLVHKILLNSVLLSSIVSGGVRPKPPGQTPLGHNPLVFCRSWVGWGDGVRSPPRGSDRVRSTG